jgi:hypothetical protein
MKINIRKMCNTIWFSEWFPDYVENIGPCKMKFSPLVNTEEERSQLTCFNCGNVNVDFNKFKKWLPEGSEMLFLFHYLKNSNNRRDESRRDIKVFKYNQKKQVKNKILKEKDEN